MSRRLLAILVGLLLLAAPLGSAYAYETFRGYTGVVIYDEANAKTAYTLWAGFNETVSYLMDLQGNIVN